MADEQKPKKSSSLLKRIYRGQWLSVKDYKRNIIGVVVVVAISCLSCKATNCVSSITINRASHTTTINLNIKQCSCKTTNIQCITATITDFHIAYATTRNCLSIT